MIKLKKNNARAAEEEKKRQEDEAKGIKTEKVVKKTAGELRLQREITELDVPAHAKVVFDQSGSIMEFKVIIDLTGEESIWRGGKYAFGVEILPNYPHDAPKVKCETPIYHPNIDVEGNVCLNILRDDWKPVLGINAVILGLIFLFIEPNPNDPLNHDAAAVMRESLQNFSNKVKRTLRGGNHDGRDFPQFIWV